MAFRPEPGLKIVIDELGYTFAGLPGLSDPVCAKRGEVATIYRVLDADGQPWALKIFDPVCRVSGLAAQAGPLASLAELPGLRVCERKVLSALHHLPLLRNYPELLYAVLMPWVEGPTWAEVVSARRELAPDKSFYLARALSTALVAMESHEVAHCDLSSSNLILPDLATTAPDGASQPVELVDVEQMYGNDLRPPDRLRFGTAGYLHGSYVDPPWCREADRFSGAVLLAELLGWCEPSVRGMAGTQSYFGESEVQVDCERYRLLVGALRRRWGNGVSAMFERAWFSDGLGDCPPLAEWSGMLSSGNARNLNEGRPIYVGGLSSDSSLARLDQQRAEMTSQTSAVVSLPYDRIVSSKSPADLSGEDIDHLEVQTSPTQSPDQTVSRSNAPPDPLAELFDASLAAVQEGKWREAEEQLGEVVRQSPSYRRGGLMASQLWVDAQGQLARAERRGTRQIRRILGAALAMLILLGGLVWIYIRQVRPALSDSITTALQPILRDLIPVLSSSGCWTFTETELNQDLADVVPTLVANNDLRVSIEDNRLQVSIEVAGQPLWVAMAPPAGSSSTGLVPQRVEMSLLLRMLVLPDDLATTVDEFARSHILGPEGVGAFSLELGNGQVLVCAEEPVRLALLGPMEGDLGSFGVSMQKGAHLAVERWNQQGGVLGRRVSLVVHDTQCDGGTAVRVAEQLVNERRVQFLVGDVCSTSSIPLSAVAAAKQVLQVTPGSTHPLMTIDESRSTKSTVFRVCFADPFQGTAAARFALQTLGAKDAAVLVEDSSDYSLGLAEHFRAEFQAGGGQVVAWEVLPAEDQELVAVLTSIDRVGPDVLYLPAYYGAVNAVAQRANEMGVEVVMIGSDGWDSAELRRDLLNGAYYTSHFSVDDPRAAAQEFVGAFRSLYGADPDAVTALTHDAVDMILRGMVESSSTDPVEVAAALEKMQVELATGDLRFDDLHNPVKSVVIYQIADGLAEYFTTVTDLRAEAYDGDPVALRVADEVAPLAQELLGSPEAFELIQGDDFSELRPGVWTVPGNRADVDVGLGMLSLTGRADGTSDLDYFPRMVEGQAVLMSFMPEVGSDPDFGIYIDTGTMDQSDYRRWGVSVDPQPLMDLADGASTDGAAPGLWGNLTIVPGRWYYLLLAMGCDGQFSAVVWDKGATDEGAMYERQFTQRWQGGRWGLSIVANSGKVYFDTLAVGSFADCTNIEATDWSAVLANACVPEQSEVLESRYVYIDDREDPEPVPGYSSYDYEAVYVSESDTPGEDDVRISELGANSDPAWSPDGNAIAYIHARDDNRNYVTVADWPTNTSRDLSGRYIAGRLSGLSWSPDGQELVLESWDYSTGIVGLTILNAETIARRLVVRNNSGGYPAYSSISWSPCGDKIAYWTREGDNSNDADGWVVRIVNVDGSGSTRITETDDGVGILGPLLWSADGQLLTFNAFSVDADGNRGATETWVTSPKEDDARPLVAPLVVVDQTYYPWIRIITP